MDDRNHDEYPWVGTRDERFTLALVLDVGEVLTRARLPGARGGHAGRADLRALPGLAPGTGLRGPSVRLTNSHCGQLNLLCDQAVSLDSICVLTLIIFF